MNALLVLPVITPMVAASLMLLTYRRALVQRAFGLISSFLQLLLAGMLLYVVYVDGIQVIQIGGWPAPYGITFVADLLAALLVTLSGILAVATSLYSLTDIDRERRIYGFYPLMQILLMGANGAFLTGDIFNLYVWFEVMLIASFVLLVLGNERRQMEGAVKYVTLNLISSALFLTAIGIVYGSVHALNLADLAQRIPDIPIAMHNTLAMLFLVAFGIKAAVFPLFFWLPDSYHTPPTTVTALFAGLLTKVGVYAMLRMFTLLFIGQLEYTHMIILVIAGFTMVVGVLGAVAQNEVRRILAFHSVSQVGYMIMGLGLMTASSLAGGIFFFLHHSLVKSNLFLISGIMQRQAGSVTLKHIGDLISRTPYLALLFLISALSLAGLPPFSGFWAKLALVQAGLALGETTAYLVIAASLAVGLFTLISMTKIWNEAFWKKAPEGMDALAATASAGRRGEWMMYLPVLLMTALILFLGLMPQPLLHLVQLAAAQLMDPSAYVQAVLEGEITP